MRSLRFKGPFVVSILLSPVMLKYRLKVEKMIAETGVTERRECVAQHNPASAAWQPLRSRDRG
jgi:hypothetical protein